MPRDDGTAGPGLAIDRVSHRYGEVAAVQAAHLHVAPGELVCLVGPSGCGKTTLLRLAAGLEPLQSGRIMIGGRVVAGGGAAVPPEQRRIGLVFQDMALFPHLTVEGNVAFGLRDLAAEDRRQRVAQVLDQVGMAGTGGRYPHMLSGGQQQRIALARALAPRPPVMLLDEPFSGLDTQLRDQVRDETLHVLKRSGVATLMVTHDPEEAMFMADRICVMQQGRIVQTGTPVAVYRSPASAFVAGFFGQVNVLAGVVQAGLVQTPFGPVPAAAMDEGTAVTVLIRPEALILRPIDPDGADPPCPARVLAARLLGRSSWIHLCLGDGVPGGHRHVHARVPGLFLPAEGDVLSVALDSAQAFVFPAGDPKS